MNDSTSAAATQLLLAHFAEIKGNSEYQLSLVRDLCVQLGQIEIAMRGGPAGLETCMAQVFSQGCEDGCLAHIFNKIGERSSRFIEIGVGDGRENTTRLLLTLGWKGVWVEGDPVEVAKLKVNFADYISAGRLRVVNATVTAENVESLIEPDDRNVDLLSIDIDMNTYHIWEALRNVQARVVCIEYNASFPPTVDFVVPYEPDSSWNRTNWFGASLTALDRLARSKRMSLVGCDFFGINAYFVADGEASAAFDGPFTPTRMYQPARYNLLSRRGHPPASPLIASMSPR